MLAADCVTCQPRACIVWSHLLLIGASGVTTNQRGWLGSKKPSTNTSNRLSAYSERCGASCPTNAHEKVFLLTKRPKYYYDADAVRTDHKPTTAERYAYAFDRSNTAWGGLPGAHEQNQNSSRAALAPTAGKGANLRNCWTIPTAPFADAHFATFPPALAIIPIKAGTSERGCCSTCGAPWQRVTERIETGWDGSKYGERVVAANVRNGGTARSTLGSGGGTETAEYVTLGWGPSCGCEAPRVPCTVLDPFAGAGTTGMMATRLGRSSVLIEISPDYADMAAQRLRLDAGLFTRVSVEGPTTDSPSSAKTA